MLKHIAVSAAFRLGISIAKMTPNDEVRELLRQLYPVTTEHELIRLGCAGDGGYLVPDDLAGIEACFSPGVDNRATFEEALLAQGIRCHLADRSVEKSPIDSADCTFVKKYVGVVTNGDFITLDRWIEEMEPNDGDLLLQMDIEGAEWPALLNISDTNLARFRIIVLELHDMERLMDKHAFRIINAVMGRLLEKFYVVHNHPNNYGGLVKVDSIEIPRALEITLLRRDRGTSSGFATQFPHRLDHANAEDRNDIALPAAWHMGVRTSERTSMESR
ncbi:FkbM family methyltransferase [Mycolicibacterium sp. Dal123E01]|uniref:FkbM family methyltransferase n=1 Tax=Mycolicibacterium sp. Dal123E01 TaxID=3457578 RepID=UPI00403E4751